MNWIFPSQTNWIKHMIILLIVYKFLYITDENEQTRWIQYCLNDEILCPQCFPSSAGHPAETSCHTFLNNIDLYSSVDSTINTLFGTRTLQYGRINDEQVVVKHPPNMGKLEQLRTEICAMIKNDIDDSHSVGCDFLFESRRYDNEIAVALEKSFKNSKRYDGMQICPLHATARFAQTFNNRSNNFQQPNNSAFWIFSHVNPEVVLLNTLSNDDNHPISQVLPKLFNWFGFTSIVAYKGNTLYHYFDRPFTDRVHLARQVLEAAFLFTDGYDGFRIYLTDATPDNIVADEKSLNIAYIDLDNVLIVDSLAYNQSLGPIPPESWETLHKHEKIAACDDCFAYVPDEICSHHLSDINVFSACQILSKDVYNSNSMGLLHSIPQWVLREFPSIPALMIKCIECPQQTCPNRFDVAEELLEIFEAILQSAYQ